MLHHRKQCFLKSCHQSFPLVLCLLVQIQHHQRPPWNILLCLCQTQRLKANVDYRTLCLWQKKIITTVKLTWKHFYWKNQLVLTAGIAVETFTMASFIFFLASRVDVAFIHSSTQATGNYCLQATRPPSLKRTLLCAILPLLGTEKMIIFFSIWFWRRLNLSRVSVWSVSCTRVNTFFQRKWPTAASVRRALLPLLLLITSSSANLCLSWPHQAPPLSNLLLSSLYWKKKSNKTILLSLLRSPLWLGGLVGNGRYGRIREYDVSPECVANQWVLRQLHTYKDLQKVTFGKFADEPGLLRATTKRALHCKLVSTIYGEWCNIHWTLPAVCVMLCVIAVALVLCSRALCVFFFLWVCVTFRFYHFFNPLLLRFLGLLHWKTVLTAHLPLLTSSPNPTPPTR